MSSDASNVFLPLGFGAFNDVHVSADKMEVLKRPQFLHYISDPVRACRVALEVSPGLRPTEGSCLWESQIQSCLRMKFVEGQPASDLARVLEVLRIYQSTAGRVLIDAAVSDNILMTKEGLSITVDTDLALKRRGSEASDRYLTDNKSDTRLGAYQKWKAHFWPFRRRYPLTLLVLNFLYSEEFLGDLNRGISKEQRDKITIRGILDLLPFINLKSLSPKETLNLSELIAVLLSNEQLTVSELVSFLIPAGEAEILKFLKAKQCLSHQGPLNLVVLKCLFAFSESSDLNFESLETMLTLFSLLEVNLFDEAEFRSFKELIDSIVQAIDKTANQRGFESNAERVSKLFDDFYETHAWLCLKAYVQWSITNFSTRERVLFLMLRLVKAPCPDIRDLRIDFLHILPQVFSLRAIRGNPYRWETYLQLLKVSPEIPRLKNPEIQEDFNIDESVLKPLLLGSFEDLKSMRYLPFTLNERDFKIFKAILQDKISESLKSSAAEVVNQLQILKKKVSSQCLRMFFLEPEMLNELRHAWTWVDRLIIFTHGLANPGLGELACPPELVTLGHRYFQEKLKVDARSLEELGEKKAVFSCMDNSFQTYFTYLSTFVGCKDEDLFVQFRTYALHFFEEFEHQLLTFHAFSKALNRYKVFLEGHFSHTFPFIEAVFPIFKRRFTEFLDDLIWEFDHLEKGAFLRRILEETQDASSWMDLPIMLYKVERVLSKDGLRCFGSNRPPDFIRHERELDFFRKILEKTFNFELIPQQDILNKAPELLRERSLSEMSPPSPFAFKSWKEIKKDLTTPYRSPSSISVNGGAGGPSPSPTLPSPAAFDA